MKVLYTSKLFLSQIRQIFVLSRSGFSQRLSKNSDDFPKTSEQMSEVVPADYKHSRNFSETSQFLLWHI